MCNLNKITHTGLKSFLLFALMLCAGAGYAQEREVESEEEVEDIEAILILKSLDTVTNINTVSAKAAEYLKEHPDDKGFASRFGYWLRFWRTQADGSGNILKAKIAIAKEFGIKSIPPCSNGAGNWTNDGPNTPANTGGMATAVYSPPGFPDIIYAGSRTGGVMKTIDGGAHWYSITDGLKLPGLGVMQILGNPNDANEIYVCTGITAQGGDAPPTISYGVGVLYSANGGNDWTSTSLSWNDYYIIGYDPNNGDPIYNTGPVINKMITHPTDPNILYALAVAPSNNDVIYITTHGGSWDNQYMEGKLLKSTDGGTTWQDLTAIPNCAVSNDMNMFYWGHANTIVVDDNEPNKVWAGFSGFNANANSNRVCFSADGGATWTNKSQGLPHGPVNTLIYQAGSNDVLYAGTDYGVYKYNSTTENWECFNGGLPMTVVNDLDIDNCNGLIYASVFGRGIWKAPLPSPTGQTPIVSISSTTQTACTELTATSNPPCTYLWSTGEYGATIVPTTTGTGIYTVTAISALGCTATESISTTITNTPLATLTASKTYMCLGETADLTATGGNTFAWEYDANLTTATTTVQPIASTIYVVTVSTNNQCSRTASITINLSTNCCAKPAPDVQDLVYTTSSPYTAKVSSNITANRLLDMTLAPTTAQRIKIGDFSGALFINTLTIDTDYTFYDSEIFMSKDAEIVVKKNKTLTLLNTNIHSCTNYMWSGIRLEEGANIIVNGNTANITNTDDSNFPNAIIQDSYKGINRLLLSNFDDGVWTVGDNTPVTIQLENITFKNNYYSIYGASQDLQPVNRLALTLSCKNVIFTTFPEGSNMMYGRTNGQSYPYAGIYLNRVNPITINNTHLGISDELVNGTVKFQNLQRGIVANAADINLSGFVFDNIHRFATYVSDPQSIGAGIYASEGSQVNVGGGYQIPHLFQNADIGIKMEGSTTAAAKLRADLYPSGLYMQNVKYGIIAADNTTLDVSRATINAKYRGIAIGVGHTMPDIKIKNSNITVGDPNATQTTASCAICIDEALGSARPDYTNVVIENNTITQNEYATNGIAVTGVKNLHLAHNTITCNDPNTNEQGILLANGENVSITENTITGTDDATAAANYTGIRIEQSGNTMVECNTTDMLMTGIKVEGICNLSTIRGNYFGEHTTPLWYSSTAKTGAQDRTGNVWMSRYEGSKIGARNENPNFASNNDFFTINETEAGTTPYDPTPTVGIYQPRDAQGSESVIFVPDISDPFAKWFISDNRCNKPCNSPCTTALSVGYGTAEQIAKDSVEYAQYQEGLKWADKRYLLELIEKHPELLQNLVFQNFLSNHTATAEGKYYTLAKDTKTALEPNAQAKLLIQQYESQLTLYYNDYIRIDSLLNKATDSQQIQGLQQQVSNKISQIEAIKGVYTTLSETLASEDKTEMANLLAQNDATTYTKQYEQNEYNINSIYLKWRKASLNNDTLTVRSKLALKSDMATLRSIAEQCPFIGGNAVFAARAMLAATDDTYFDDRVLCTQQGVLWRTAKPNKVKDATNTTWSVAIAPNPTTDKINITLTNKHPEGSIELYDLYGRLLETVVFGKDTNAHVLDINTYTAGVYIVKVKGNDSNSFTKKVVLIK